MLNAGGQTVMAMAYGVNYPYIHSNNFEMNRFFSYSSDLKLTSHHTYVMHYLTQHYKKCFLSRVDWLVTELKKKTNKQRNKKQNNWLFTEVTKVAHKQFIWGFHNAGDS